MVNADVAAASLYVGSLRHRRYAPVRHEFRYPVFMVLLDVDRIAEAMTVSRFTSHNRWNWASFMDGDHFGDATQPLRSRLAADAARAGVDLPDGRLLLLTHLRYLGYCFNPVSFFYCFDRADRLVRVLAEVNNTFGGTYNYWLDSPAYAAGTTAFRSASKKALYVSPFLEADLTYGFAFNRPGPQLTAHIDVIRSRDTVSGPAAVKAFDATLMLTQQPWTAASLRRTLVRHPWMTASVVAGIHWQALRLWWKGVAIVPRPSRRGEFTTPDTERAEDRSGTSPAAAR